MNKYARIASAVVSVALLATSFAGCGKKEEGKTTADGKTIITKWDGNTHAQKVTEALAKEFNETIGKEKNIEYRVEFKEGGTITQNMDVALSTGQAPDFLGGGNFRSLVEQDYLLAIDEFATGAEIIAKYADSGFLKEEINQYNGKTYSVPSGATTQGMVYNKDMFKAAGIVDENGEPTPPETWDEFREYAKKLTNEAEGKYGTIAPLKWTGFYGSDISSPVIRSQGYKEYNPTTGKYDFTNIAKIAQYWVDMKNDGSVYPDAEAVDNDPARARFSDGIIGMKLAFSFDVGVFNDQFPATCDWGVAHYPLLDKNVVYKSRMDVGGTSLMNAAARDRLDAMETVFKWSTSDEHTIATYTAGVSLPWNWDIVKDVELPADAKHGWKEFAALTADEAREPQPLQYLADGIDNGQVIFVNEVWSGNKTAAEAFKEYEDKINAAVEAYYEMYPEKKEAHADRVDPTFIDSMKIK